MGWPNTRLSFGGWFHARKEFLFVLCCFFAFFHFFGYPLTVCLLSCILLFLFSLPSKLIIQFALFVGVLRVLVFPVSVWNAFRVRSAP